jgi:hypothetical protein
MEVKEDRKEKMIKIKKEYEDDWAQRNSKHHVKRSSEIKLIRDDS